MTSKKLSITTIQVGGSRHLGFRKTAAISLLFDRLSPKLGFRLGTYPRRRKCIVEKIQDGGRRHLEFRNMAKYPKFKMETAAISDFEKFLRFLYYFTFTKLKWKHGDFHLEHIYCTENA